MADPVEVQSSPTPTPTPTPAQQDEKYQADTAALFQEPAGEQSTERARDEHGRFAGAAPAVVPTPIPEYDIDGTKYKRDDILGWRTQAEAAKKYQEEVAQYKAQEAEWKQRQQQLAQREQRLGRFGNFEQIGQTLRRFGPAAPALEQRLMAEMQKFEQEIQGGQIDPTIYAQLSPLQQQVQQLQQWKQKQEADALGQRWQNDSAAVKTGFKEKHGLDLSEKQVALALQMYEAGGFRGNPLDIANEIYGTFVASLRNGGGGNQGKTGVAGLAPTRGEPPPIRNLNKLTQEEKDEARQTAAVRLFAPS